MSLGKTPFSLALARCGLSHSEAAELLSVRLDTVKSQGSGRSPVPQGVWDQLRSLEKERRILVEDLSSICIRDGHDGIDMNLQAGVDPILIAMLALKVPVGTSVASRLTRSQPHG